MRLHLPSHSPCPYHPLLHVDLLSPEKVAEGILKLATDESKVGAVMTITLKRGVDYYRLPGDQKQSKTSKL